MTARRGSDRRVRRFPALALAAAVLCALAAAAVSRADAGRDAGHFRRGIGLSHVMAWATLEPGSARAFASAPFAGVSDASLRRELRTLRLTGFDFVRLAVDPGPFLQFTGAPRAALDRLLLDRVKLILGSGLAAIVDVHPSDMQPDYTAQALTAGAATPAFRSYLHLLRHTAGLLGGLRSGDVALELMNEPPVRPGQWQPMLEAAYAAAREGSAELAIVLEGGDEASAAGLGAMATARFAGDPAVRYAFHYYEPYQFTHQGASWNPARYLADVPYPALARPLQDSLDATAAAIAADHLPPPERLAAEIDAQRRLQAYRRSGFDGGAIAKDFDRVAAWARAQDVPADRILLGEFGARQTALQQGGARAAERARWFHDVSGQAESHGFGWAVWTYRGGGGFALAQSKAGEAIEPDIARALGLTAPPRAALRKDGADDASEAKR